MRLLSLLLVLTMLSACSESVEEETMADKVSDIESKKSALFKVLSDYEPGAPATEELTARISSAAEKLEKAAGGPPDLRTRLNMERVTGHWVNLFSSQGVTGEIELKFMTRALPGGGVSGGTVQSQAVLQELRPEERFYRNTLIFSVGDEEIPALHIATADLGISESTPNLLEVRFKRIEFMPARAKVTQEQLRELLKLPAHESLGINVPIDLSKPAPTSAVTYLDDDLRINRGETYIAILRKVP